MNFKQFFWNLYSSQVLLWLYLKYSFTKWLIFLHVHIALIYPVSHVSISHVSHMFLQGIIFTVVVCKQMHDTSRNLVSAFTSPMQTLKLQYRFNLKNKRKYTNKVTIKFCGFMSFGSVMYWQVEMLIVRFNYACCTFKHFSNMVHYMLGR